VNIQGGVSILMHEVTYLPSALAPSSSDLKVALTLHPRCWSSFFKYLLRIQYLVHPWRRDRCIHFTIEFVGQLDPEAGHLHNQSILTPNACEVGASTVNIPYSHSLADCFQRSDECSEICGPDSATLTCLPWPSIAKTAKC
jgi:hypothetical protein